MVLDRNPLSSRLSLERAATEAYLELLEKAEKCIKLYEAAHANPPDSLVRLLGDESNDGDHPASTVLGAIERPDPVPPGIDPDWVSLPVRKAAATSVALAVLRTANGSPMRVRELYDAVNRLLPDVPLGSVANIGTRLSGEGTIGRTDEGWVLLDSAAAGVVVGERLWAPAQSLQKYDLAERRREAILQVLAAFDSGLQAMQVLELLRKCPWVKTPLNKDLLKADLNVLRGEGKIRQRGNSKKWELAPTE